MKLFSRITVLALFFCMGLLPFPARIHATEGLKCLPKHSSGPPITTPARAALKRQCDAIKRGIASLPGMKQLFPNCRLWGTQASR